MARTFIRQDTQIRRSDSYDDTVASSLANFETNPTHIEDDLNNLRSVASLLIDNQSGDWYTDLNTPSTLDAGSQRGVNDLNTDLHANERKRILRRRQVVGADVDVPAGVQATGSIDCDNTGATVAPADTETFVLDDGVNAAVTFEFDDDSSVSETATLRAVDITTAADDDDVRDAIITAVTGAPTLDITATSGGAGIVTLTHDREGTVGNVTITETVSSALFVVAGMTGGAGDVVVFDAAGELPGNTTAAVGVVTSLGTVVAYEASFGTATLTEVAGGDALTPKNLCKVADSATGDPIVDGTGREIHALLQSESNTDKHTMAVGGANDAQLSFVVHSATNDDLELVDGQYIAGQTIDYSPIERYAFEDIPEHAWLGDDFVDVGAASTTRQGGYDNQGTVAVNQITNATLDLEGAGLSWEIRDDLEASLLKVTEGSAGGTSVLLVGSDVDTFDVDAAVNDFLQGVTVDSGNVDLQFGVTAGHVETIGASDDLHLQSSRELFLDDVNQTGSTWAQTDGIKLSETQAEWDAFEVAFGAEVSLLAAITAANSAGSRGTKTYANCNSTTVKDTDIGGSGGGSNLDAQLPDMSGGTFLTDYDTFVNGDLMRPGADASANNDYYPGTSLALGQLKFEFPIKNNDVLCVIPYA